MGRFWALVTMVLYLVSYNRPGSLMKQEDNALGSVCLSIPVCVCKQAVDKSIFWLIFPN